MIFRRGSVHLVGAGPGDPELITVRGMRLIEQADVIIHDRLIPHEVLNWCQGSATLVDVGKYPEHHRISQAEINQLLIKHALDNQLVVRLKGGDPFVFGRGQEEVEACRNAGITCHIVPGVSSSIAGPAAVGIPVTTRGIARSFTVVTGQTAPELGFHNLNFQALANTDTVILMMARKNLSDIAQQLIEAGRSPDTPAACIERATYSDQRVICATLSEISSQADLLDMKNPMITVIGEVAAMVDQEQVEWPEEIQQHFYATEFGE